ncbi:MAG: heme-copper oxidase subunit III [Cyanobacteriota bacterium]|nr:heme-copper oxidase subunit III [Cyanobacteriota bacterium]
MSSTPLPAEPGQGGHPSHAHGGHNLTGMVIFLLSESIIFLAFFAGYAVLKSSSPVWLPEGVEGLEVREPLINTVILVSSSFVAYFAERALRSQNLWGFRALWGLTMAMGAYFVFGQAVEWAGLPFSLQSGIYGGSFYLLTGFHGLHVITGVLLMGLMLFRSFRPGNYDNGDAGVTMVSLFWHFVDVIWIILFVLIYVWQRS